MEEDRYPIEITKQSAKKLSVLAEHVFEADFDDAADIVIEQRYAAHVLDIDWKRVLEFDLTEDDAEQLCADERVDVDRLQEVSLA